MMTMMRITRWRHAVALWLRGLLRRDVVERELDDEIRDHIERQTAANLAAGMPPHQARRAALVAFGGVEHIKERSRDVRRLSLIDDVARLRYAARSLGRARTFTSAVVTTIALAVAAACTVIALVNAVLLRPLPYPDSSRLVALWHSFPGINMPLAPQAPGTYALYRSSAASFESIGVYTGGTVALEYDDPSREAERIPASGITASILSILRVQPAAGRLLAGADEQTGAPPVVVISERFWRERLGSAQNVIGRRLRIEGTMREVVGVLPSSFAFPGSDVRIWVPLNIVPAGYVGTFSLRAIGRLRPGVSREAAERELSSILMRLPDAYAEVNPGMSTAAALAKTRAVPVIHSLRDDAIGGFEHMLWLIASIVGLLVAVALSNVASLALARAEVRRREFAVRATLGASASRLAWSIVAEAGLLAGAAGIVGAGIAAAVMRVLTHAGPTDFPDPRFANAGVAVLPRLDELHVDWMLGASAFVLTLLFGATIAAVTAWRVSARDVSRILRNGGRTGTAGVASHRLRATFVAVQVALSLVLLCGSAVLAHSLLKLSNVQPGFNPSNVITFWTSPPRGTYRNAAEVGRFYRDATDRLARVPGVASVGVVSKPPLQFAQTRRIVWVEDAPAAPGVLPPDYAIAGASDGYFAAMGIPLLAGRDFRGDNIRRGDNEAVVSRAFATKFWSDSAGARALGRRFRVAGNVGAWYRIVGVVGDVRDTSLAAPPEGAIYLPEEPGTDSITRQRTARNMAFVVRTRGGVAGVAELLRREMRALDPAVPVYDVATMDETVAKANSRLTLALLLLATGAAATLTLGVVGLYGVLAYLVGMRTREIGIRIALGLAPSRATWMILREGEAIVVAGAAGGLAAFVAFAKLLRSLTFGVSVVDGRALAGAVCVVLAVATLATWLPARRAARIDPADTLKLD